LAEANEKAQGPGRETETLGDMSRNSWTPLIGHRWPTELQCSTRLR